MKTERGLVSPSRNGRNAKIHLVFSRRITVTANEQVPSSHYYYCYYSLSSFCVVKRKLLVPSFCSVILETNVILPEVKNANTFSPFHFSCRQSCDCDCVCVRRCSKSKYCLHISHSAQTARICGKRISSKTNRRGQHAIHFVNI